MAETDGLAINCPRCGTELLGPLFDPGGTQCQVCGTLAQAVVFPALFRSDQLTPSQLVLAGEAACFFHDERVAVVACGRCGRFVCQFCRIDWAGEDLCPACVESSSNTTKDTRKVTSACFRYDSLALMISALPILT